MRRQPENPGSRRSAGDKGPSSVTQDMPSAEPADTEPSEAEPSDAEACDDVGASRFPAAALIFFRFLEIEVSIVLFAIMGNYLYVNKSFFQLNLIVLYFSILNAVLSPLIIIAILLSFVASRRIRYVLIPLVTALNFLAIYVFREHNVNYRWESRYFFECLDGALLYMIAYFLTELLTTTFVKFRQRRVAD
jgi:hypothetical protein